MPALTDASRVTAAILLFGLVTVETGGMYLVSIVRGHAAATPFQLAFARAGHAHAGVLLILSLVALLYADAVQLSGVLGVLGRSAVPAAALLMPAGFFFSSIGDEATSPNRSIALVYVGAASLAVGLTALGLGLLLSG